MTRMPSAPVPSPSALARAEWLRRLALLGLGVAVAAHLFVLYVPQPPGIPLFPGADKLVHAAIFAAPTFLALLAGFPPRAAVAVIAAHAPISEMVQHFFLSQRAGDVLDVLADLTGVVLGVIAVRALGRLVVARAATRHTPKR